MQSPLLSRSLMASQSLARFPRLRLLCSARIRLDVPTLITTVRPMSSMSHWDLPAAVATACMIYMHKMLQ